VIVRKLTDRDNLAPAIALLQRFFREEGFDTPADVIAANTQRMAALDTCGLFVAENNGASIAVVTVSMEFGIEFGWSAEMGDLYVLPEWRGKGVSTSMLGHVEAYLVERGASGYQVTVTPYAAENHGLANFYSRVGFDDEGRIILFKDLRK
jgi:GNAT superfamily N-acetyltransferase